jgi:hypothetical protein
VPELKFRWAVGEPGGPQACPWTLTVRGSDAVLTVRVRHQHWHLTFHKSGWRHWRFDDPATLARAGGPVGTPDADVWHAPDAVDGVVTEFMEISPTSELRLPRTRRLADKVNWIAPPSSSEAMRVVLARIQASRSAPAPTVWSAPLASGETLAVMAIAGPLNREEAALLARTRIALAARAADAATLPDPAGSSGGTLAIAPASG